MPAPNPPSPLSAGITWAYRIIAVSLEFAVPALLGAAIDRWWGTSPIATLVGACLGFAVGIYHLIRLANAASNRPGDRD